MEHGKIEVKISEDYPGAEWYDVTITLPGYGGGDRSKFKLVPVSEFTDGGFLEGYSTPFFRPEYAKAIKKGLESV